MLKEYNSDLRDWANKVIETMTKAGLLFVIDPQKDLDFFYKMRHDLLVALSSEIDKGRLFLPNKGINENGQHKPSAYRGFKSEALEAITNCYNFVKSINFSDRKVNDPYKKLIMEQKKNFVSEI